MIVKKLFLALVLFVFACLLAGGYGALHNQISYTVSPEYFTKFKFHQFQINEVIGERLGAAIVGWSASWWMGIFIGIILIPMGLLLLRKKPFLVDDSRFLDRCGNNVPGWHDGTWNSVVGD